MKDILKKLGLAALVFVMVLAFAFPSFAAASVRKVYRVYTKNENIYTTSQAQYMRYASSSRKGIAWYSPVKGKTVYSVKNKKTGGIYYTDSFKKAKNLAKKKSWSNKKKAAFKSGGTVKVYRAYNKKTKKYYYTANAKEYNRLNSKTWSRKGVAFKSVQYKKPTATTPPAESEKPAEPEPAVKKCDGTLALTSTPAFVNRYTESEAVVTCPTHGKLSVSSSNETFARGYGAVIYKNTLHTKASVSVIGAWGHKESYVNETGYTITKDILDFGSAKITVTFTPDSGYEYSGPRSVSFTVKNTVFPCNSDGSYTITYDKQYDGRYTGPVLIGGKLTSSIYLAQFPSGSVIRSDMSCIGKTENQTAVDRENDVTYNVQNMTMYEYAYDNTGLVASSNPDVAFINPTYERGRDGVYPYALKDKQIVFYAPGKTDLIYEEGRILHYIVSGPKNEPLSSYVSFIRTWPDKVKNLSNVKKVETAARYINTHYEYGGFYDAYLMFQTGVGDCWAGNSLLYSLCKEMGFDVTYRNAAKDMGAMSGHRNCVVTIDGVQYIADATPGILETADRSFMKYDDYMKKYGK